jgi:aminopeptidase N
MKTKILFLLLIAVSINTIAMAQLGAKKETFTHADTLRGSLNANRDWWDVLRYDLTVKPNYENKTIEGKTEILFKALKNGKAIQLDLQAPLIIDSIFEKIQSPTTLGQEYFLSTKLKYSQQQSDNIAIVNFENEVTKNSFKRITIYYHGKPREAINPPWDGGWIWKKDAKGRPWMSVACQGLGASVWYPCKDHQSDEPDNGASLTVTIPDTLIAVGNGRLINQKSETSNLKSYTWEVKNPINNYLIIPYIGKYVNFTDTIMGEKGKLDLSYWVLDYDLEKAKEQFKQAKLMLHAFEYWFGPYPFYEDSYKLVEAPHLGMEHQSATAYGNKFMNGYLGRDLSGTGWGLKWDYIIVHESGHEWFANNITTKDIADMWVHEGITDYSETLFTEYYYGKEAGNDYNYGQRRGIGNKEPVIGFYGVNKEGSQDMYPKGANMMHTIRHSINDDEKFRNILRGLNKEFYHQTVTTQQVENYISKKSGFDYSKVFDQYLRATKIPVLEYYIDSAASSVTLKWDSCVAGFDLPIVIQSSGKRIKATTNWQTIKLTTDDLTWFTKKNIERYFYIKANTLTSKP